MPESKAAVTMGPDSRYKGSLGRYFWTTETDFLVKRFHLFGEAILDLGCGTGRLVPVIAEPHRQLVALDLSFPVVQAASKGGSRSLSRVSFLCGDALELPFQSRAFTGVIALGTFGHDLSLNRGLQEIRRVLTDGGCIFLSLWNKERLSFSHAFRGLENAPQYSLADVEQVMRKQGFAIIDCRSTFFIPRKLFWGAYKTIPWSSLRDLFVHLSRWVERFFMGIPAMRYKGWELLVVARAFGDHD